jgi:hypothetical protein
MEPTDSDFFNLTEDPSNMLPDSVPHLRQEISSGGALSIQRVINDEMQGFENITPMKFGVVEI